MTYNLLPEKSQKKINLEYRLRLLTLIFYFSSAVLLVGFVLLIPSYVLLEVQKNVFISESPENRNSELDKNRKKFAESIKGIEDSLKILEASKKSSLKPHELIDKIADVTGEGVYLNRFTYSVVGASTTIIVDGNAGKRDDFLAFVDRVKKTPPFKTADFPVELLARSKDIKFTITVK